MIEEIRATTTAKTSFIMLAPTQVPPSVARDFDEVLSIFDPIDTLAALIERLSSTSTDDIDSAKELSPREKDIVVGIVKGLSNKEIAAEINVSVNTVMTHRRNITRKLQIHSPAALTIYAIVSKLVRLDEVKALLPS